MYNMQESPLKDELSKWKELFEEIYLFFSEKKSPEIWRIL